nr:hypothetical protein [Actinospica robiniae]
MHEYRPDLERSSAEGGFFQKSHHGHDGVVTTEIVIEPEFVDELVAVLLQELDAVAAGAGDPGGSGERSEIVYAEDDGRPRSWILSHPGSR